MRWRGREIDYVLIIRATIQQNYLGFRMRKEIEVYYLCGNHFQVTTDLSSYGTPGEAHSRVQFCIK